MNLQVGNQPWSTLACTRGFNHLTVVYTPEDRIRVKKYGEQSSADIAGCGRGAQPLTVASASVSVPRLVNKDSGVLGGTQMGGNGKMDMWRVNFIK